MPNGGLLGRITDLYHFESNAMQQAITDLAPDVIHAHWTYEFAAAAVSTNIPHVITCHDSPSAIARLNTFRRPTISAYRWLRVLIARKVLREAKCVTAVSPYIGKEIQRYASVKINVVANPVDDLTFQLARPHAVAAGPRLIMVCNGWDVRKNPQPALNAFVELRKNLPQAEFHLYGHGFGLGEKAQLWCSERRISDGMVFHGAIPHQDLLRSLATLDLLLHPSIEESFGMVVAEAMAMGIPIVAGRSSGAVPWVVGTHGTLCDIKDKNAIVSAVKETLEPSTYARLSNEGIRATHERFSTARITDQFYSLYEQSMRQQKRQSSLTSIEEIG
jgi:glycosyltransferase involved in cell wall biosynthesis